MLCYYNGITFLALYLVFFELIINPFFLLLMFIYACHEFFLKSSTEGLKFSKFYLAIKSTLATAILEASDFCPVQPGWILFRSTPETSFWYSSSLSLMLDSLLPISCIFFFLFNSYIQNSVSLLISPWLEPRAHSRPNYLYSIQNLMDTLAGYRIQV